MNFSKIQNLNKRQSVAFALLLLAAMWSNIAAAEAQQIKETLPQSSIEMVEQNIQPLVHISGTKAQQSLKERMAYYNTPGVSIAVIHNGKIDWAKGYGFLQESSTTAVTPDTGFEAASISKPVTALTAMVQAQNGSLDPDAPIDLSLKSWHVPAGPFSTAAKPTARNIMCHHGGFNVEFVSGYRGGEGIPSLIEILNGQAPSNTPAVKLIETPGKKFQYSAGGFLVLQQALIDLSHKDFQSLVDDAVFQPLDMHHSTFLQPPLMRPVSNLATGHDFAGRPAARRNYPELSVAGLRTTPTDLCRIILELQEASAGHGHVLNQDTAKQILTAQDEHPSIGLGFFLAGKDSARRFSMDGWNYGFTCRMAGLVEKGEGAVVMTNSDNGALMFEVLDAIGQAYNWPVQPISRSEAQPLSADAANLIGRYKWTDSDQAEIISHGSRLFLHVFHNDKNVMDPFPPAELFAKSGSEFFTRFPTIKIRYEADSSKKVTGLIYDIDGKDLRAERIP